MRRFGCALALVAIGLAIKAAPAHACSVRLVDGVPAAAATVDGKSDVPTNLVVAALFPQSALVVREAGDDSTRKELQPRPDRSGFTFLTAPELQPHTAYELRCVGADGREQTCATFMTGDGDDDTPPDPPVASVATHGEWSPPTLPSFDNDCAGGGGRNDTQVQISVEPQPDAVLASFSTTIAGSSRGGGGFMSASGARLFDPEQAGGEARYEVTVVDQAGNASAPTTVDASLGCEGSCAQADVAAPGGLVAALLLLRRRRPASRP